MAPTNNGDADKLTPHLRSMDPALLLALLVILAQVVISIATYPFLPPNVPSHWGISGQVNGYMPKWLNVIFYPGISLFLLLVVRGAMRISPQLGQASARRANQTIVNLILVAILLFMLVLQLVTTLIALGAQIDVTLVIITTAYSYYAYRHYTVDGKEPLSPPFTDENGEG